MKSLLWYKIGLAVVGLFTIGLIVFVVMQSSAAKQDKQTTQAASSIADKVNNYVDARGKVPDSLAAAGVHNAPSTITYQKLTDSKYRFCITYRASGGSGAVTDFETRLSDATGIDGGYPSADVSSSDDQGILVIPDAHNKGTNCQTVTTYVASTPASPVSSDAQGQNTVCGVKTDYYDANGAITVVDLTGTNPFVTVASQAAFGTMTLSFEVSPDSKIFDTSCNQLSASDLHVGDTVGVYDIVSPTTSSVSIFLKE